MNAQLSNFAGRIRFAEIRQFRNHEFNELALELFALQFKYNSPYARICEARGLTPEIVEHWTQIPSVPAAAFKELELSCIPPAARSAVFYSSGTTEQKPSRHFHCAESLKVYEAALWKSFVESVVRAESFEPLLLTPPPLLAPHSSLVHMFETVRRKLGAPESIFIGRIAADGAWALDFDAALVCLSRHRRPKLILGTAFSFVHLLYYLAGQNLRFDLPPASRVMETGGYKNRSRSLSRAELRSRIAEFLGISPENIISEYGMSELSSQAYDVFDEPGNVAQVSKPAVSPISQSAGRAALCGTQVWNPAIQRTGKSALQSRFLERGKLPNDLRALETNPEGGGAPRLFQFPPWARVRIVSPETGDEVADGETGLIRVFDLANVFSVAAIQTEDLAVRRGDGFDLAGRAPLAEPRGCSLMTA